jgi:hypothetical protein
MEVELVVTKNAGKTRSTRIKPVWVKGEENTEFAREKALWGRTCEEPTPMPERIKYNPDEGMTPELQSKLWLLDNALEEIKDEELGHYLIEKILGFDDDPDSQRVIEAFENKYL